MEFREGLRCYYCTMCFSNMAIIPHIESAHAGKPLSIFRLYSLDDGRVENMVVHYTINPEVINTDKAYMNMDTWRLCCTEIRHDAELHTPVSKVPYCAQTPIKSSKSLFTEDILDNAQDTDAWAESFDTTIGHENDGVTQIDEAIEDTCMTATLMELFPVVPENLEKAGFINTEGMDNIYANVSRGEISN